LTRFGVALVADAESSICLIVMSSYPNGNLKIRAVPAVDSARPGPRYVLAAGRDLGCG
jgi:hypothetical protein